MICESLNINLIIFVLQLGSLFLSAGWKVIGKHYSILTCQTRPPLLYLMVSNQWGIIEDMTSKLSSELSHSHKLTNSETYIFFNSVDSLENIHREDDSTYDCDSEDNSS